MDILTLKTCLEENKQLEPFYIFVNTEDSFLSNQYVREIAVKNNLKLTFVEDINSLLPDKNDIFGCDVTIDTSCLYVHNVDKFEYDNLDIKDIKNLIIITNKIDKEYESLFESFIVTMPKLEEWQIKDYVYSIAEGVKEQKLDWLMKICNNNIYRLDNEVSKIALFNLKERDGFFDLLVEEDAYSDLSNFIIFDLTNALLKKDRAKVCSILQELENIDVEPIGLATVMFNNFRNMLLVQLTPNATAEKLGMKSNQFYAISKSCGAYNRNQIIDAFQLSARVDFLLKTGQLPADKIIDYIILKLLGS